MKLDYKKKYFFLAPLAIFAILLSSLTSCDEQDDDAYIDFRTFEGSWYRQYNDSTSLVISFFRSIVYKDILENGAIIEHTEYGMIESVAKTTIRVNGKTCEYKFEGGRLYLKEVIVPGEPSKNDWMVFLPGEPLYGN